MKTTMRKSPPPPCPFPTFVCVLHLVEQVNASASTRQTSTPERVTALSQVVEYCNPVKSIKYVCMYINKDSDKDYIGLQNDGHGNHTLGTTISRTRSTIK